MRYVCTTPPTAPVVSLAEVRQHSRIDSHDDDVGLVRLIEQATRTVQRHLSRQFVTATWKLYLDQFPDEILLTILPVAAVTSITYVDTGGTTCPLTAYQTSIVSPDCPGRIKPAYGTVWPSTKSDTYNAVTVTFTAGYGAASAVPDAVKRMLLLMVDHWNENRGIEASDAILAAQSRALGYAMGWLLSTEEWGDYG